MRRKIPEKMRKTSEKYNEKTVKNNENAEIILYGK
jgi:hypothetical protein